MGLFAAAPSLTAGAGANAGGGRGGAFQIQTSLRQTDRSGGETDASPDADGTSGDGPSFEAVLQSAAHSQDSTPPAASDQGNGADQAGRPNRRAVRRNRKAAAMPMKAIRMVRAGRMAQGEARISSGVSLAK